MRFCVLGSGSKGNCTLVESGDTRLLIDAGFSGKEIKRRLESVGLTIDKINALLVTHEHRDHISGVGIVARQCNIPVYANDSTHMASESITGVIESRLEFETGKTFEIGSLRIHPFRISHDTIDPVGFIITDGHGVFGYCTDTGKVTHLIRHHLKDCHGLVLEANHDQQMLQDGPYPLFLQQRVRSSQGHLANNDAGKLLQQLAGGCLHHVVLAHLSQTNNIPELALKTVENELSGRNKALVLTVACQNIPSQLISVGPG